jgi:hypothetical protein
MARDDYTSLKYFTAFFLSVVILFGMLYIYFTFVYSTVSEQIPDRGESGQFRNSAEESSSQNSSTNINNSNQSSQTFSSQNQSSSSTSSTIRIEVENRNQIQNNQSSNTSEIEINRGNYEDFKDAYSI